MDQNNDLTVRLRTIISSVRYLFYEQKILPFDLSDNFITFSIQTIKCLSPRIVLYPHVLSRLSTYNRYECIRIIASKGKFETTKFLY
jgi:hypothetical protein